MFQSIIPKVALSYQISNLGGVLSYQPFPCPNIFKFEKNQQPYKNLPLEQLFTHSFVAGVSLPFCSSVNHHHIFITWLGDIID